MDTSHIYVSLVNLNTYSVVLIISTTLLIIWTWSIKPPPKPSKSIASTYARSIQRKSIISHLKPLPPPPSGYKSLPMLLSLTSSTAVNKEIKLPDEYVNSWKSSSAKKKRRMTLVLDLDETLVHASASPTDPFRLHGGEKLPHDLRIVVRKNMEVAANGSNMKEIYVWKRPFLAVFLREMSKLYEIVIFTAGQRRYASPLIDEIDELGVVRRRYFRDSCLPGKVSGKYNKDLQSVVSPEHWPERTVLLDNSPCTYEDTCPNNAVPIKDFFGNDSKDIELLALIPFLTALSTVNDVRSVLQLRRNPSKTHSYFAEDAPLMSSSDGINQFYKNGHINVSKNRSLRPNYQDIDNISEDSSSPYSTPTNSPKTKAQSMNCEEGGGGGNSFFNMLPPLSSKLGRSRDKGAPPSPGMASQQQQQQGGFSDWRGNESSPSDRGERGNRKRTGGLKNNNSPILTAVSSMMSSDGNTLSLGGRARSGGDKAEHKSLAPFLFRRKPSEGNK